MDVREAERIVKDRKEQYGEPATSFSNIAKGWSTILRVEVTPKQVALAMMWLKICREMHSPKDDNLLDIVGYAITYDMINDQPSGSAVIWTRLGDKA